MGLIFYKRINSNFFFLRVGRINGKVICLFNKNFCKQPKQNYTDIPKMQDDAWQLSLQILYLEICRKTFSSTFTGYFFFSSATHCFSNSPW
jgi:hypothetical protein